MRWEGLKLCADGEVFDQVVFHDCEGAEVSEYLHFCFICLRSLNWTFIVS